MTKMRLTRTAERVRAAGKSASVSLRDPSGRFEKLSEDKPDSVTRQIFTFQGLNFTVLSLLLLPCISIRPGLVLPARL